MPSGRDENRASSHYDSTVALHSGNRDGVVSIDSQVQTVPDPQPQRGPSPAAGVSDPEYVSGKGQSRATGYSFNICHWNAEGTRTPQALPPKTTTKQNKTKTNKTQQQ